MKLPAYPRTKPSGVEWLGDVPEHWEVKRGRFAMRVNPPAPRLRALNPEDEVSFVPMDAVGVGGGLSLEQTRILAEVAGGYTEFQDGDVVVAKITPCFENGKAALASGLLNGAAYGTTELHVLRAGQTLDRSFLFYVAISDTFRKLGESEMYGAGGQKRVPPEFNKNFRTPLPPPPEQRSIAAFLDRETGRVDRLVAKKRELIERLKEKRTALISKCVTGGLDLRGFAPSREAKVGVIARRREDAKEARRLLQPYPHHKPSGIDWLGNIPKHWEVCKLKRVTISRCDGPFGSGLKSEHYCDEGVRVIRLQNIRFAQFDDRDAAFIEPDYYKELGDHGVLPGDLLIAGLGDENHPVGRACVAPPNLGPAMVKADCFRFRLNPERATSSYVALQLSTTANALAGALATGTTRGRMNLSATEDREIALPPSPNKPRSRRIWTRRRRSWTCWWGRWRRRWSGCRNTAPPSSPPRSPARLMCGRLGGSFSP